MNLHKSIQCLDIDSVTNNDVCDYDTAKYMVAPSMNEKMTAIACQMANRKQENRECAENICKFEANFLLFFLKRAFSGKRTFDESFVHAEFGGTFNKQICEPNPIKKLDVDDEFFSSYYDTGFYTETVIDYASYDRDYFSKEDAQVEEQAILLDTGMSKQEHTSIDNAVNDPALEIKINRAVVEDKLQCCGEHPKRFPYHSKSQGCCSNREIFTKPSQECCIDGAQPQVVEYGTC